MNWCKEHWDLLRKTIDDKGMGHLVPNSGQEAAANIKQEIATGDSKFDPLMGCWARINVKMLHDVGLSERMFSCPLCILVEDGQPETVWNWVDGCTNDALQYAISQKLIGEENPLS